jgi:hypothetical protein
MSAEDSVYTNLATNISSLAELAQTTDSNASVQTFEQLISSVYQQLIKLSELSIFAPAEHITQLKNQLLDLVYQLDFDPLFGGLVLPYELKGSSHYYQKHLEVNSLIAEFLLHSDRLLYTGELTQIARAIFQYLHHQVKVCEQPLVNKQSYYAKEYCENTFELQQLESILENNESLLLNALISEQHSGLESANQNRIADLEIEQVAIFYRRSLSEAANLINMPIKQAQIIQHSMQLKLKHLPVEQQVRNKSLENPLLTNCLLLRSLSNGIFYLEQPQQLSSWQASADKMANALIALLNAPSTYDHTISEKDSIQIIVAATYYLQTNFNVSLYCQLIEHLKLIDLEQFNSQPSESDEIKEAKQHLELLAAVISAVAESHLEAPTEELLITSLASLVTGRWKVQVLEKNSVQLDRQLVAIKSEFNPYRFVFCI